MSEAQKPILHILHTVYVYTVYLSHKEGGGRFEPEKRLEEQQFTKLGRKYQHDWLYLQSINSDKYLLQVPLQVKFLDDEIFFGVYIVN